MGKRGPKKQPAALAKAKGTYRPSRNEDEIADSGALDFVTRDYKPDPPASLDEVACKIWVGLIGEACKLDGYISTVDLVLFEVYCKCYSEMLELETEDRTYTDENGVKRLNPLFKCYQDTRKEFIRLSAEFGFSPAARTRIKLQPKPPKPNQEELFTL